MSAGPVRRPTWRFRVKRNVAAYLVLLPTLAVLAVLAYYPALNGMWHSFYDWRPGFTSEFIGLDNFRTMLADDLWWSSFRNLGVIFVVSVTLMWVFPLLAAEMVITLKSPRSQFVFRTLLIAPMAFPGVVTVLLWSFMYDPHDGVINTFLRSIGLDQWASNWVGNPSTALGALLAIGLPWIASLPFLVFLTQLQNVPKELFEAAELDGANRWRRFFAIDLPLLSRQLRLLLFLATISVLQYGFAAYLVTGGGPDFATQVPVLHMLNAAFEGQDWGYAATLSTTLFVLALGLSAGMMALGRRSGEVRRG